jgi:hypothetical protein
MAGLLVGVVGLIFLVSSLFSNVISTLALPVVPILSVGFFHDKMECSEDYFDVVKHMGICFLYIWWVLDSKPAMVELVGFDFSVSMAFPLPLWKKINEKYNVMHYNKIKNMITLVENP